MESILEYVVLFWIIDIYITIDIIISRYYYNKLQMIDDL